MKKTKVFISYSHQDKKYLDYIKTHLKPLERDCLIDIWEDTRIKVGSNWQEEINKAVDSANIAILLISKHFLASDFIINNELPPLLKASKEKGATVIPIIIDHCLFKTNLILSTFQAINDPNQPITKMQQTKRDETFLKLAETIQRICSSEKRDPKTIIVASEETFKTAGRDSVPNRDNVIDNNNESTKIESTSKALMKVLRTKENIEIGLNIIKNVKESWNIRADMVEALNTNYEKWYEYDFVKEKIIPPIIKELTDNNWEIRKNAADVLRWLKAKDAVPFLITNLEDDEEWVVMSCARALGDIEDKNAIESLIKAGQRKYSEKSGGKIMEQISQALIKITHKNFPPHLPNNWLTWWEANRHSSRWSG